MPKVSVVMPVYNRERYVREAIDSILSQTYSDFELIVIDDASTDRSASVIESRKDSRTRVFHNPKNLGLIKTRNLGLSLARGQYVATLDSDDVALPQRLALQAAFLDANPHIAVLGCLGERTDEYGAHLSFTRPVADPAAIKWQLILKNCIINTSVMYRRDIILGLGGYRDSCSVNSVQSAEDYDLWCRVSREHPITNLPQVLVKYKWHQDSITGEHLRDVVDMTVRIVRKNMEFVLSRPVPERIARSIALSNEEQPDSSCLCEAADTLYELFRTFKAQGNKTTPWINNNYSEHMRDIVWAHLASSNARVRRGEMLNRFFHPAPGVYAPKSMVRFLLKSLLGRRLIDKLKNMRAALYRKFA